MTLIDDILDGLPLQSSVFCRITLSGSWGFAKEALEGAPFHLMLSGRALLSKNDTDEVLRLDTGDIVVLPRGEKHDLVSSPDAETVPFRQIADGMGLTPWTPGTRYRAFDLRFGSGHPMTTLISGIFAFDDHRRNPILEALPSFMLMRRSAQDAGADPVASIVKLLDAELLSGMPGNRCVGGRLADILFIQVLQHFLSSTEALPQGWLRGLSDREIGPALAAMHRHPDRAWSVACLAHELGMSRSRFAARFQDVLGQPPLEYLTQWSMYQAAGLLRDGAVTLPALAASVGYQSEVSFGKAFALGWSLPRPVPPLGVGTTVPSADEG